jgi:biotin carboxyl carrier protein
MANKVYKKIYVTIPAGEIYPFIPGTVLKLYVKEGDIVNQGDRVFVLQAMKMNNEVLAPISGTVKKINIKEGERVSKNDPIMLIE